MGLEKDMTSKPRNANFQHFRNILRGAFLKSSFLLFS